MARDVERFEIQRFVAPDYDGAEFVMLPPHPYAEHPGLVRILAVTADAPVVFHVAAATVTTPGEFASACYAWLAEQEGTGVLDYRPIGEFYN